MTTINPVVNNYNQENATSTSTPSSTNNQEEQLTIFQVDELYEEFSKHADWDNGSYPGLSQDELDTLYSALDNVSKNGSEEEKQQALNYTNYLDDLVETYASKDGSTNTFDTVVLYSSIMEAESVDRLNYTKGDVQENASESRPNRYLNDTNSNKNITNTEEKPIPGYDLNKLYWKFASVDSFNLDLHSGLTQDELDAMYSALDEASRSNDEDRKQYALGFIDYLDDLVETYQQEPDYHGSIISGYVLSNLNESGIAPVKYNEEIETFHPLNSHQYTKGTIQVFKTMKDAINQTAGEVARIGQEATESKITRFFKGLFN